MINHHQSTCLLLGRGVRAVSVMTDVRSHDLCYGGGVQSERFFFFFTNLFIKDLEMWGFYILYTIITSALFIYSWSGLKKNKNKVLLTHAPCCDCFLMVWWSLMNRHNVFRGILELRIALCADAVSFKLSNLVTVNQEPFFLFLWNQFSTYFPGYFDGQYWLWWVFLVVGKYAFLNVHQYLFSQSLISMMHY